MPEACEVFLQGEKLRKFLNNTSKVLYGISWDGNSKYSKKELKGFKMLKFPQIVKSIFTRGKIIVFECNDVYITVHLGMTGCFTETKTKHSNLWFTFDKTIYFDDMRHFGNITVCKNLSEVWKKNGPCLLTTMLVKAGKIKMEELNIHQTVVNREYWNKCLTNNKNKNHKICDYLIEQKYFSGIGNYLRSEIMFRSEIHPERTLSSLSTNEINILYTQTIRTIYSAYKTKGPPSGYIEGGSFQLFVYGQNKDPFGNPVLTYKSKGRTIHFSPKIQK